MTDNKHSADEGRDHVTDDRSPHTQQAPHRRSWTGTTISALTAR